jgi:hypothetical protein
MKFRRVAARLGLCSEQSVAATTDHLHTATPALAGIASTVVPPATASGDVTQRRLSRRTIAAAVTMALVGGGAFLATRPAGATSALQNAVTAHGAPILGSPPAALVQPIVGMTATPSHKGYWLVASDGGVFAFGDAQFFGSTGGITLARPIVGIASTPTGRGYWLVASDGGVFSFGDARFHGSLGGRQLAAPIVGMAASGSGNGYWLVGNDGGVFSFGDAGFHGSVASQAQSAVTAIAASNDGGGYYLLSQAGGVYAFGDAHFHGSLTAAGPSPAISIAPSADGNGYVIVHADGTVNTFNTAYHGSPSGPNTSPSVGIATGTTGYWIAHGQEPALDLSNDPFLVCTRHHESDTSGGYHAVSASGTYRGAYQFDQSTWNNTARATGRFDLVGVDPAQAAPADQDFLAWSLHKWRGAAPWGGRCAGL